MSQTKNIVDNKSDVTKSNQSIKKKEEDKIPDAKTPPPLPIMKAMNGTLTAGKFINNCLLLLF